MQLAKWIKDQGRGARADLARDTGPAYNTVHEIYAGKRRANPGSAMAINRATGGAVTLEDLASVTVTRPKHRRPITRRPRARTRPKRRVRASRVRTRTRAKAAA